MRKLLNTLYVIGEQNYLHLKNENIVIVKEDGTKQMVPLIGIESIIMFSYKGASPELIGACRERGIGLSFLTPNGKFLAMPSGRSKGNVLLRKEQYRISDDVERSLKIAKVMILGKAYNATAYLKRFLRSYPLRIDEQKLGHAIELMQENVPKIKEADNADSLRGFEGKVSDSYFSVFNELILNQKEDFVFNGRSRRPPLDNINAALSFGYILLAHDCASALESVGLDSYVGFMHTDRPGRESLALDLMEELRVLMVDRTVISMINKRVLSSGDFEQQETGGIYLNEDGRKKFLTQWQTEKQDELAHPFLKEKIKWGLVPYVQALLLARYIRGDYDEYPVFLWK